MVSTLSVRSPRAAGALLGALALAAFPARADIGGRVLVSGSGVPGTPIAGAWVHLQGQPVPGTFTDANGDFSLPVSPAGSVVVTAAVPYFRGAAENFLTGGAFALNGQTDAEIRLEPLPSTDDPGYEPASYLVCSGCHNGQAADWQTSHHAFTASNAWVRDLFSGDGTPGGAAGYVFKNTHDPGDSGFCATCHAPMRDRELGGNLMLDDPTLPAYGAEGVNCVTCHQMDSVDAGNLNALHHLGKATYRFPDSDGGDTYTFVWGPLDDVTFGGMRASHSTLHRQSLLCASCHQYANPSTGAPGQNTYGEWLASPFAQPGPGFRTCQDCHMPPAGESGTICAFGGIERPPGDRRRHTFIGTTPETLAANLALTASAVEVAGRLQVSATVDNFGAGHSFPTGLSARNAILWIEAALDGQPLAQVAGPTIPWWADDEVPGTQPGDLSGLPGKGFAKVLSGRINGQGPVVRPVLFIDAEAVDSDTLIPSGALDVTTVEFALPGPLAPGAEVDVTVRLLWRRAFRALAVTKGWTTDPRGGPIEIEVHRVELAVPVVGGTPFEIPAAGAAGLAALALALGAFGLARLRRRRRPTAGA